jgi:cytochrome c biogenesis protein CcmG, thiol:disulfide interchange protein DsbE
MATSTKPHYVGPGKPKKKGLSSGALIGIVVVAVLVLFGIVAVVASVGGSNDNGAPAAGGGTLKETNTVTWTGEQLPPEPDSAGVQDLAIGKVPPTLSGFEFDGTPLTIDPSDGKAKMVVFVAHWCPHCQREVPRIVQWNASGQTPAGLEIYGVATGTDSTLNNYPPSSWLQRESWTFPTMADGPGPRPHYDAATAYGLSSYPYIVIVGADGTVKARHSGEFGADDASAEAALNAFVTQALAA